VTSFDIVAVAASAGGLNALTHVLHALPDDFAAAIVVVQHLDPRHRSLMAEILGRRTGLKVRRPCTATRWRRHGDDRPPNNHLLVNRNGSLTLTQTELVHFLRPSADLLFESTAAAYRERAIAVVLSGSGSDGAMGVKAIKKMGGTVIVQDRQSSEFAGMPGAAQQTGMVDFVLPLQEIALALQQLVRSSAP
jgi:two-component system chemotaxis response regulator CheB